MSRCLYNSSFEKFITNDENSIFGVLCDNYHGDALTTTREAWKSEISIIKGVLSNYADKNGQVVFDSSDHIRFQNGQDISGHNYGCNRRLVIKKNIQGEEGYTVTMYNLDGVHPLWKNYVHMSRK